MVRRSSPDLLSLIAAAAAALFMTWAAGHYTIFDDEAFSCRRYVLDAPQLIDALRHRVEPDPPLYYLLIHGWIRLFGLEPFALRSLSILIFFTGVALLRAAAMRLGGASAARMATLLAVLHPLHLFFGFAARWYALLFACIAGLLWCTAALCWARSERPLRAGSGFTGWCAFAAAACYTNYFAVCVVGLIWLTAFFAARRDRNEQRRWILCGCVVLLLYAPWLPTLIGELGRAPRLAEEAKDYLSTAARTVAALATGNLADPGGLSRSDPGAWWVWAPMTVAALLLAWAALPRLRRVAPLLWIAGGAAGAGIATLTMIDKYVMSFSAAVVLAAALILSRDRSTEAAKGLSLPGEGSQTYPRPARSRTAFAAMILLFAAWGGCYVNLYRESGWSSLRWHDPIPQAVETAMEQWDGATRVAATHPSVGYYWGLQRESRLGRAVRLTRDEMIARWQAARNEVLDPTDPASASLMTDSGVRRLWLIETAAVGEGADRLDAFKRDLSQQFRIARRTSLLRDPVAQRKNRLDPDYYHPVYRVVIYEYVRR